MRRRPRSEEGSGTRIVRNSLVNGLGSLSGVLITLFLTPLMIDRLGASGYGVWVLATSLTFALGYLSFAELGIEASAVRFIAEARGAGDRERASAVLSTSLALFLGLTVVLTPVMVLLAAPISRLFAIPEELTDEARLTFTILAAQLALDLPSRPFSAVIQGAQRYGLWQAVELSQVAITAVTFVVVLLSGGDMVTLAVASTAIAALMLLTNVVVARLAAPDTRPSRKLASIGIAREIGVYGGQVILFRLGGLVYRQTDKTIIGILLSATLVTTWEIAFKIQAAAALIQGVAASALVPAVAFNRANLERMRELLVRGSAYAMALSVPTVVAAFVFADPLIRTWIGEGFDEAVGPTRLFLGILLFASITTVGQSLLVGLGRLRGMLILIAISIVLNLVLSIALARPLGVEGVVLGTLICEGLVTVPLLRLYFTELDVKATEFLRRVVLPLLPAAAAEAAVALALLGVAERTDSLAIVALLAVPGVLAFGLVYVFVGLGRRERRVLYDTARSTIGRGEAFASVSAMGARGVRTVELTERACAICGAGGLEPLWRHEHVTETRDGPWRFPVIVALCRRCALVLASPAPAQHELDAYYRASVPALAGQELDFSVDARLELLDRYADTAGRLVEIGGNESGPFADRSAALFAERVTVEPNQGVDSDFGSIAELAPASADLVAHYFVLEHVTEAREFLRRCHEVLREGGTMVCEVPDISLYPRDASALLLHEHVNHFSPATLARLARSVGFTLERVDHARCSRPFGFAAVFTKGDPDAPEPAAEGEVQHARSCVEAGAAVIESWWAEIDALQRQIEAASKPVVVWAANDSMATLLSRNELHDRADLTLVDSDPAKSRILGDMTVVRPEAAASVLATAELLVICTPHHAERILEQTRELVGGELRARTRVLGTPVR